MTTPIQPTLSVATDKAVYSPGDTVTLTCTYVDSNGATGTVEVTAQATDTNTPPNTATATTSFQVGQAAELMQITVTDTAGDTWTQQPPLDVVGTSVFTTIAPSLA
jgi:hypothetical protein